MIIVIATFRKMKEKPNIYQPPETQYEDTNKAYICETWTDENLLRLQLRKENAHTIHGILIESLNVITAFKSQGLTWEQVLHLEPFIGAK